MKRSTSRRFVALCAGALVSGLTVLAQPAPRPLGALVVPAGFKFEVFAENVPNARMMALGPQGTVFVGSQYAGNVYAVVDRDGDHKADSVMTIAKGLRQPNGVAIRNGALYVATTNQILRFDDIEKHLDAPPAPVHQVRTTAFPGFTPKRSCPADSDFVLPVSAGALTNAYAEAGACFAAQIDSGKKWTEIK